MKTESKCRGRGKINATSYNSLPPSPCMCLPIVFIERLKLKTDIPYFNLPCQWVWPDAVKRDTGLSLLINMIYMALGSFYCVRSSSNGASWQVILIHLMSARYLRWRAKTGKSILKCQVSWTLYEKEPSPVVLGNKSPLMFSLLKDVCSILSL